MSSIEGQIAEVLAHHPLKAGTHREAGRVICDGCHRVLGDPTQHLTDALSAALDPFYSRPAPVRPETTPDHRESQIEWRA